MLTGDMLDLWLSSRAVNPVTREKYHRAVGMLKETLAFVELEDLTGELIAKVINEDKTLQSVLSMTLDLATKRGYISKNLAKVKRDQRKPNEGSLSYRADRKSWLAQVTSFEDGKRITKSRLIRVSRKTSKPPAEAIKALVELKAEKDRGLLTKGNSPISELMNEWLSSLQVKGADQAKGLAVRTYEQYADISKLHIVPGLGRIKIKDLKRSHVEKWLRTLEAEKYERGGRTVAYSANTLRLCRAVLAMALEWARREGIAVQNVARDAKTPGGRPRPEKHAMNEDQARRLIEATRGTGLGALWALMITTGLRRGEALGLRWKDFDGESISVTSQLKIEGGKVTRGDLKTDKSKRKLRLPNYLIEDLEAHRAKQIESHGTELELMFTNSMGMAIRPDNLQARFWAACNQAGIEPHSDGKAWSVHELRHTAASQLLSDQVPMQIVSRTLGHSSIGVTLDVYAHLTDRDSELVADSMARRYGSKETQKQRTTNQLQPNGTL